MTHSGLEQVKSRIAAAAQKAGRKPEDVTLIAVSKTFGPADIRPVIAAGQSVFGENRVQEAKGKWPQLRMDLPGLKLHLIGPLQSNKAAEAIALFDAIHTIDRPKIAAAIAAELARQDRQVQLFIQVNTGREPQKAGVDPDAADRFIASCREDHRLVIGGVMCIPPQDEPPARHFEMLAGIAARNGIRNLSMGMSGDFEEAISCGATHVRVGSAIFGHRPSAPG